MKLGKRVSEGAIPLVVTCPALPLLAANLSATLRAYSIDPTVAVGGAIVGTIGALPVIEGFIDPNVRNLPVLEKLAIALSSSVASGSLAMLAVQHGWIGQIVLNPSQLSVVGVESAPLTLLIAVLGAGVGYVTARIYPR